jgi:hypothetical protein
MWFVKMSIPGDRFFEAMHAVSGWLSEEHIKSPHFSYSRDMAGEIKFRISFSAANEADRFAARFDGSVLPPD